MISRRTALMACLCGFAIVTPAWSRSSSIERRKVTVGDWQLTIRRDRFSQGVQCRLGSYDHRAIYQQGALGFRFKRRWDVAEAAYRIDGGLPHLARDDLPALVDLGVPIDIGGIANPNEGIVWIPYARLASANSVAIEPRPNDRARIFHFRGLTGLKQLAKERGCVPESRFVR